MGAIGVECPDCGRRNRDDAAFCGGCGGRLPARVRCAGCGRTNTLDDRFCDGCGRPLGSSSDQPDVAPAADPVAFVDRRYLVERLLGQGAHKQVYLARDVRLDRHVAFALIKVAGIHSRLAERIRQEARAMGRLAAHPNVVTVYDAGEDAGRPFIVEEYVEGGTVAALLHGAPLKASTLRCGSAPACAPLSTTSTRRGSSTAT